MTNMEKTGAVIRPIVQVVGFSKADWINEFKDFKLDEKKAVLEYVGELLSNKENHKIQLQRYD